MKDVFDGYVSPIYVAPDYHLVDRDFYLNRVWLPARQQHKKLGGTKAWLTALEMVDTYDGCLYFPDGKPFRHDGVTDVFSTDRWIRGFLQPDETGKHYKTQAREYDRLQNHRAIPQADISHRLEHSTAKRWKAAQRSSSCAA